MGRSVWLKKVEDNTFIAIYHEAAMSEKPIFSGATPAQVAADLAPLVDFQPQGMPPEQLEALLSERLLPHLMRYDSPQFQSMFNAFPPAEGLLGGRVALEYNQGVTNWQVSPGGAMLEELCCRALCRLFGLEPEAGATFLYSGTYGNQQALYMALYRQAERQGFDLAQKGVGGFSQRGRPAVLVGQDTHFSIKHAVRMLGLGEDCLVTLPTDGKFRIGIDMAQSIARKTAKMRPIACLIATAGTTSTGAVDPIKPLADLSAELGSWFHVDGAYGYAYKLVPEYAHLFSGDTRADSISWDPHKQMGAPIPNSLLFVRNESDFSRMALHSHYFNREGEVEPNPGLKSPPSTRPMSALPLVTILRGLGLERIVELLRAPLTAISSLADYLATQSDVELCHRPDTGIVCFRMTPPGLPEERLDELQRRLYNQLMSDGRRSISITKLKEKTVLRLVLVAPHATFDDLKETIDTLRQYINS